MNKLDIVGHFGSRFSYATVSARIARAVRAAGFLGTVINLDDVWMDDYGDLASAPREHGTHALLFTDTKRHVFDVWAQKNSPERVAIFSSPNTTLLDRARTEGCARAGRVLVPSVWCSETVARSSREYSLPIEGTVAVLPLGVDASFVGLRRDREWPVRPKSYLHFSTDFAWPSRKGTEMLLQAWKSVGSQLDGKLTVHVPMAIYEGVRQAISDLDLVGEVKIKIAPDRGTTDVELAQLYREADVLVQPSLCEGFGMMMLAAVVSETPLVTTPGTGQADFLASIPGWLGVATGTDMRDLAFESGVAPVVTQKAVEDALLSVASPMVYAHLTQPRPEAATDAWTWEWAAEKWVTHLKEWVEA